MAYSTIKNRKRGLEMLVKCLGNLYILVFTVSYVLYLSFLTFPSYLPFLYLTYAKSSLISRLILSKHAQTYVLTPLIKIRIIVLKNKIRLRPISPLKISKKVIKGC